MILKPEDLSIKDNYKLIIGSVLPRPIALVSTLSDQGIPNLAPFSFFTIFRVDFSLSVAYNTRW